MNGVVAETAAKVESCLSELGGAFSKHGDDSFFAKRGSAVVVIRISPWEEDAMVTIEANVVEGASLAANMLSQLLEFNHTSTFGAFGLREDGMITVHHCLLGSRLDPTQLLPAVLEVARIADDWDDVIVEQAGGKTAVARLKERVDTPPAQPTIEPPPQKGPE